MINNHASRGALCALLLLLPLMYPAGYFALGRANLFYLPNNVVVFYRRFPNKLVADLYRPMIKLEGRLRGDGCAVGWTDELGVTVIDP